MPLGLLDFDKQVVDVCFYIVANFLFKHLVNRPLVGGPSILKAIGHHSIAVQVLICDEGGLFFIFRAHLDLIVPGVGINKTQHFVLSCQVDNQVDARQRKLSFKHSLFRSVKSTDILN